MSEKVQVSIVGASGYAGGELLRLLLGHPYVEVKQVTSEQHQTKFVYSVHPNLRSHTTLKFSSINDLENCDLLFVSLPHGSAMEKMPEMMEKASKVIDLSADHRLDDPAAFEKWYNEKHANPDFLSKFVLWNS